MNHLHVSDILRHLAKARLVLRKVHPASSLPYNVLRSRSLAKDYTSLRKAGFTLIELLAALAVLTAILGIGAIAFSDVSSLSRAQGRYHQRRAAAEHFLRQFAEDVRAAKQVSVPRLAYPDPHGKPQAFEIITSGGESIAYSFAAVEAATAAVVRSHEDRPMPLMEDPAMRAGFDLEERDGRVCAVVATVEWDEPPAIGVSHPILSLRVALRRQQ